MGRIYRVPYTGTLTNAGGNSDLLLLKPATNKPCRLAGWILGQSSEEADAQAEALRLTVQKFPATVTDGSGGSSVTPPTPRGLAAPGFTARCNDTTVATTSGTAEVLEEIGWNIQASPWERYIPEELRSGLEVINGEALIVRCEDTPADDLTVELTFFVEEL